MPDASSNLFNSPQEPNTQHMASASRHSSSTSLRALWKVVVRRRRLIASVMGGLVLLCLLYCLIAPNQYEASAKVALRATPASSLSLDSSGALGTISSLSSPLQLETLANVFRSDQLAWRVITELKLYQEYGFMGRFAHRFPGFRPEAPSAGAQAYLLERFQRRLTVQSMPRTLLIQIRFRSKDAALSAAVVNALIRAYGQQDSESRVKATVEASGWLKSQLKELKAGVERDRQRLTAFKQEHGILSAPQTLANGQPDEAQHNTTLLEIDELGRQLAAVTTDRILREAEYRAASQGDPELVIASDLICKPKAAILRRRSCSRYTPAAANWNRRRPSSSPNMGRTFPAWWRFAASCRIWTGRRKPKTPNLWEDFAAPCRRRRIANRWRARVWKHEPPMA